MTYINTIIIDGLSFALPLFIMAIGGIYCERSGVTNLAIEGLQGMGAFVGALAATLVSGMFAADSQAPMFIAMIFSFLGGGLYAVLHAVLCVKFKANQVISGVVINILATALTTFLTSEISTALFGAASNRFRLTTSVRMTVPGLSEIPVLGAVFTNIYPFELVIIVVALVAWYVLYKTPFGMHLRACGDNPHAVDAAGVEVSRVRFVAVMISGALSGLGGICFAYSISVQFSSAIYMGYGYLAIAGGSINAPEVMGSRSTNLKCGIGGWKGRALITGDYLPFCTRNIDFIPNLGSHTVDRDDAFYGFDDPEITLRVVPGPQEDMFTQDGVDTFYGQPYTTTSRCDRMGFRLDGPEIETVNGSDIISDGIALGAVQIPADGRPIIMLSDRQTTGGYAKIGTVCSVDLPKLVQCTPGRVIRFAPVTIQQAQDLYRQEARRMDALAKMVRRPCYGGISPRRTARRLTPILEAQARAHASGSQKLWIELSKTEQQRLQPAEQPASDSNR